MQKRTAQALSRTALFGADSPAEPPHEFLIWSYGTVETTKGDLDFTRVDADRIVAEWQRQGNDLPLDYGHGMAAGTDAADPAEAGKAAGWFALEARDDGLWAVRVRWTEAAAAKLSAKEYRYFSPWIALDDDGRVAELFNLALTNIPATLNQRPLMAADKRGTSMMRKPRDGAAVALSMMDLAAVGCPKCSPAMGECAAACAVCEAACVACEAAAGKVACDACAEACARCAEKCTACAEACAACGDPACGAACALMCAKCAALCAQCSAACAKLYDGQEAAGRCSAACDTCEAACERCEHCMHGESAPAPEPPAEMTAAKEILALTGAATLPEAMALARAKLAPPPPPPPSAPEMPETARVALAKADAERVELSKQLAVERAELAKIRHADARREVLSRVQQLKALAGSEHEALADDILALQGHDAALAARFEARLVAAHVALAAGGGILDPIGSQRADSGPDPVTETERRAELFCRTRPGLSVAAARVQVWREDPALYAAHHAATMPPAAKPKADDAD